MNCEEKLHKIKTWINAYPSVHNFQSYTDIDFQRCWALKNLQLLPSKENMSKGAKLTKHFQPSLLL